MLSNVPAQQEWCQEFSGQFFCLNGKSCEFDLIDKREFRVQQDLQGGAQR